MTNPSDQLIILQSVVMMADGVFTPSITTDTTVPKRARLSCSSIPTQTDVEQRHVFSDYKKMRLFSRSFDGGISVGAVHACMLVECTLMCVESCTSIMY